MNSYFQSNNFVIFYTLRIKRNRTTENARSSLTVVYVYSISDDYTFGISKRTNNSIAILNRVSECFGIINWY